MRIASIAILSTLVLVAFGSSALSKPSSLADQLGKSCTLDNIKTFFGTSSSEYVQVVGHKGELTADSDLDDRLRTERLGQMEIGWPYGVCSAAGFATENEEMSACGSNAHELLSMQKSPWTIHIDLKSPEYPGDDKGLKIGKTAPKIAQLLQNVKMLGGYGTSFRLSDYDAVICSEGVIIAFAPRMDRKTAEVSFEALKKKYGSPQASLHEETLVYFPKKESAAVLAAAGGRRSIESLSVLYLSTQFLKSVEAKVSAWRKENSNVGRTVR